MEIESVIERILFYNEFNGYTIGEITYHDEKIKIVGFLPNIEIGDKIKVLVEIKTEGEKPYLHIIKNLN